MYPQHWLLAFGGHQGDVEDIWNCGIRLSVGQDPDPTPGTIDEDDYLTTVAVPALSAWFARPTSQIASAAVLQWIKFNEIAPDGTYANPNDLHEVGVNVLGFITSTTSLHPLQVSAVLSWRTDAKLQPPGAFGRIYMPRPAIGVSAAGDIGGSARVDLANSAADLLNDLDVTLPAGVGAGFLRPSIVSAVAPGYRNFINTVVVDSSLDVQRRRSNRQSKEISSAPVVY